MDKLIRVLYKKVHRQYLREFKKGRKFKYDNKVHEIIKEPYIDETYICIDRIIDNKPEPVSLYLFDVQEGLRDLYGYGRLWYVRWIS